jgi:hypothetical protein
MRRGSVTLGDLVDRIAMLEVACSRCQRRGRLRVDLLIERHGDAELRLPVAGDCPKAAAVSISDQCDIYFPGWAIFKPAGGTAAPMVTPGTGLARSPRTSAKAGGTEIASNWLEATRWASYRSTFWFNRRFQAKR